MHPILLKPARLGFFLAVFLPAGLLLGELMVRGPTSRLEAWTVSVPLMLVHAMSCLAAWYLVKSLSLEDRRAEILLVTHLVAAGLASGLLLLIGTVWVHVLDTVGGFGFARALFGANRTLVFFVALLLFSLAVAVHYVALAVEASQAASRRAFELRILAREAELKQLRNQIDPHFLFNSLNSISSLVTSDPRESREMCVRLADFFRRSLRLGERQQIPLAEEVELVQGYLRIEKVRFGDRLRFVVEADDESVQALVPPLLLQPLVENAVRHGIAGLVDGGTVTLLAWRRQERLHLVVENDHDPTGAKRRGVGIGLENVRARLAVSYGGEASVRLRDRDGVFRVELTLPIGAPRGDENV
jgi:two-component system sensor histidine kinase AlgZ